MQQQQQQTMTVLNMNGQPTPVIVARGSNVVPQFSKPQAIGTGSVLIVCALLSFAFNIVDVVVVQGIFSFGFIGHGFWVGVMVSYLLLLSLYVRLIAKCHRKVRDMHQPTRISNHLRSTC